MDTQQQQQQQTQEQGRAQAVEDEDEDEDVIFDVARVQGHRPAQQVIFADQALECPRAKVSVLQVPRLSPLDACLLSHNDADLTGNRVWPGARILAQHLAFVWASETPPESVLDLGAGTGLLGLALALVGAGRVVLTDGEEDILDLLRRNADLNPGTASRISIHKLPWSEADVQAETFDLVVAAECVYDLGILPALLATAARHLDRARPSARFIMCNCTSRLLMDRDAADELFIAKGREAGFSQADRLDVSPALEKAVIRGAPEDQRARLAGTLRDEPISFLSFTMQGGLPAA